jgi:hypothetical protein
MQLDETPAGLIALYSRVDLYRQVRWQSYEQDDRREPTDKVGLAQCASSRLREQPNFDTLQQAAGYERHYLMIDLDVQSYLVPSTTPGHSHLYIDREIPWRDLEQLLRALAACGIIEPGYANASIERKSTTLRLPWIKKEITPEEGAPMKVRYMLVDAGGNWIPRSREVAASKQRFEATAFIDAHPDLTLIDDGTAISISHTGRGLYLIRPDIEALLDEFSIVAYLTWVKTQ